MVLRFRSPLLGVVLVTGERRERRISGAQQKKQQKHKEVSDLSPVAPRRGGAHGPPLCEIIAISHRPILLTLSPVETRLTIPIDRVPCTSQLGVFLFSFRPPFKLIGQPHFSPRPTTDWHGRSESRQKARVVRDLAPAGPEPVGVGGGALV